MRKILLLATALSGCGVSQELYDQRTNELDRTRGELSRTQAELARARARSEEEAGQREHAAAIEAEYLKLKKDLNATEKQLGELKEARRLSEQRGEVYRGLLERLRDTHAATVEFRKGRILVRVPGLVLFEPGKAELKPEAQATLRPIATALKDVPDREFLVAGHTDSQPVRGTAYRSNWDLSAARAVAVVRFLQQEGVSPSRLSAAAYSEFEPRVEAPTTPEERAANERMEIVIMPSLEELPSAPDPAPSAPAAPMPPKPTPPQS